MIIQAVKDATLTGDADSPVADSVGVRVARRGRAAKNALFSMQVFFS